MNNKVTGKSSLRVVRDDGGALQGRKPASEHKGGGGGDNGGDMEHRLTTVEHGITRIDTKLEHLDKEVASIKWWMVGTGVAVVLGIAAFNATVLGNMVASFESGKNTAAAIAEASKDQELRERRLERLEQKLDEAIQKNASGK